MSEERKSVTQKTPQPEAEDPVNQSEDDDKSTETPRPSHAATRKKITPNKTNIDEDDMSSEETEQCKAKSKLISYDVPKVEQKTVPTLQPIGIGGDSEYDDKWAITERKIEERNARRRVASKERNARRKVASKVVPVEEKEVLTVLPNDLNQPVVGGGRLEEKEVEERNARRKLASKVLPVEKKEVKETPRPSHAGAGKVVTPDKTNINEDNISSEETEKCKAKSKLVSDNVPKVEQKTIQTWQPIGIGGESEDDDTWAMTEREIEERNARRRLAFKERNAMRKVSFNVEPVEEKEVKVTPRPRHAGAGKEVTPDKTNIDEYDVSSEETEQCKAKSKLISDDLPKVEQNTVSTWQPKGIGGDSEDDDTWAMTEREIEERNARRRLAFKERNSRRKLDSKIVPVEEKEISTVLPTVGNQPVVGGGKSEDEMLESMNPLIHEKHR